MRILVFAVLALALFTLQTESQDSQPSYQDTMTWLKAKVLESSVTQTQSNPSNGVELEYIASYRGFSWSGCSVTVGSEVLVLRNTPGHGEDSARSSSTIMLNLADMSPKVEVDPIHLPAAPNGTGWAGAGYTVSLSVTTGELKVHVTDAKGQPKSSAEFSFDTQSQDTAQRMANAFSAAIRQCGGKAEPY